jgi:hypothetical protein
MKPATRWALFVGASVLFAAWIGWLVVLAVTASRPVVVHRAQVLVSDANVIAQVDALDGPVTVKKVLRTFLPEGVLTEGQQITVANLKQCQGDWSGPGEYLLILSRRPAADGFEFKVNVPLPAELGLDREKPFSKLPHIYRATPDVLAQLQQLTAP